MDCVKMQREAEELFQILLREQTELMTQSTEIHYLSDYGMSHYQLNVCVRPSAASFSEMLQSDTTLGHCVE